MPKKIPVLDPKVAAYMNALNDEEIETEDPVIPLKPPPANYNEFLKNERLDEWPERLASEGTLDLSIFSADDFTKDVINKELSISAPFGLDVFDEFAEALNEYESRLMSFTLNITNSNAQSMPSRLSENLFHAPGKEFLERAANSDAVKLHPSHRVVKKNMKQALQEEAQALKTRDVTFIGFPGFRPKELTELPSQLEAPQLLNKVTEAQVFNKGFLPLWKKLFLSEASAAILQDAFWWLFLEMFQSNPDAQDKLFTRLAGSYIALFHSVHPDIRDKFFTVYPRCLSQAVYLTFLEAFPQSHDRFGEEFVSEISSPIYQWVSGVKPPVGHWKSWPFDKMLAHSENALEKHSTPFDRKQMRRHSNAPSAASMRFDIKEVISGNLAATPGGDSSQITVKETDSVRKSLDNGLPKHSSSKQEQFKLYDPADSTPAGPGPDMERVLFNMGGRSPLVSHYLYIKNLKEKTSAGRMMKRTEVVREPTSVMTFDDIIKESKQSMKTLHEQRRKNEEANNNYIKKIHHQHRKALSELKEAEKLVMDPVNLKLRCDRVLDEAREKQLLRRVNKVVSDTPSTHIATSDLFK